MKQKLILFIAVLAGLLAFGLTVKYLRSEKERMLGRYKRIWVIAAADNLPAGSILKTSDLGKSRVFQRSVGKRAILPDSVRDIVGKRLLFSINLGDPVFWSDVDVPYRGEVGLAEMIVPGMRAISISVDAVSSVSGMVKPNDHVDILGTFSFPSTNVTGEVEMVTLTVLQDVTVLATGQRTARGASALKARRDRGPRGYSTITFEVTPREAELLVFAQTVRGHLYLSLRHPSDVSFLRDIPHINFDHLQNKLEELNLIRQRDIRHKKDI